MRNLVKGIKCYSSEEQATTAVEFALIGSVFLTMIFGIFETGRLFYTTNAIQYAAEQATRKAIVTEDVTVQAVENEIIAQIPPALVSPANLDLNVSFVQASGVNFVQVSGQYTYRAVIPLMPEGWTNFTIPLNSRMALP